jgi:ribonucleoside-diphosphate reductase alpha chain
MRAIEHRASGSTGSGAPADLFESLGWQRRDARLGSFVQHDVEVPCTWSQTATDIVAAKYLRGQIGGAGRETSVRQLIARVSGTIVDWMVRDGRFSSTEHERAFHRRLVALLVHQRAAFNSPVWFNVGFEETPQTSACFVLGVDDDLDSILHWSETEARVFAGGSGAGINLSCLAGAAEPLAGGGNARGPLSYLRATDAWAGAMASGGHGRAAKMAILDIDHPDVQQFIGAKAAEEDAAAALAAAGLRSSVALQNTNVSVRLTDSFLRAVDADGPWHAVARRTGERVGGTMGARRLLRQIAHAAWRCADPGVQYADTIESWHTTPNAGPITASNPCGEFLHLDNSACNLASLNLLAFRRAAGGIDVEAIERATEVMLAAQDSLIDRSAFPTATIAHNSRRFRQLGLGYTNLGGLLMAEGVAYDSDAGRAIAGTVTALIAGAAVRQSARMAAELGPYAAWSEERDSHLAVLERHWEAVRELPEPSRGHEPARRAALAAWNEALALARAHGMRNAQTTALAPTGTISLLMDCDTTGIEPVFALVTEKRLRDGAQLRLVAGCAGQGLASLGYDSDAVSRMLTHLRARGTLADAPDLAPGHRPVFATAIGQPAISARGHLLMIAAVQPFVSGGVSKTVNLRGETTVEEIYELILEGWRLGLKSLAFYRDGSKTAQVLAPARPRSPFDAAVRCRGGCDD